MDEDRIVMLDLTAFGKLPSEIYRAELDEISAWRQLSNAQRAQREINAQVAGDKAAYEAAAFMEGKFSGKNPEERGAAKALWLSEHPFIEGETGKAETHVMDCEMAYQKAKAERKRLERTLSWMHRLVDIATTVPGAVKIASDGFQEAMSQMDAAPDLKSFEEASAKALDAMQGAAPVKPKPRYVQGEFNFSEESGTTAFDGYDFSGYKE